MRLVGPGCAGHARSELTGMSVLDGSPTLGRRPRSRGRSPYKRAAGEENFRPETPVSLKNQVPLTRTPEARSRRRRALRRADLASRLLPPAASSWSCCLGWCCHGACSIAAVHCARTTALQLLDNRSEACVKVLAVCLAVLHGELARERHLPPRSGGLWCGLPAFGGG